jgi:hypothetical protein
MKSSNHRIELLGNRAHRRWADRPSQDRQQRLADLADRKSQHETGQDHAVELLGTSRIGAKHRDRRKAAGARHRQLDLTQLAQQMPPV